MADGSVIIEAILDTANVPKQINSLKGAIKGVSWSDITKGTESAKALSSAFSSAGTACTAMFTVPMAAAGKTMMGMGMDFEDAMAKVSTIADTTAVPLGDLEAQILDLSDQTGVAASDIAENVYNAISAGQETGDAVAFVENATKLATAGFTDSASALDVLTTTMNAYKDPTLDAAKVSDILLQTQNKGKTTVGELSASMGKAIPTASAFNVNLQNLAAAYATTTANGIATAESTTYINSMIKELGDSGSTVGGIIEDQLGMSFSDAMESGMSLGDVLNVLNDHCEVTGYTMYDLFGSAEAASAATTLAAGSAEQFSGNLAAMGEAAGITDESFEKMNTTSFDLNRAINQVKNVMTELGGTIGQALQPVIDGFVKGAQGFSDWFKSIGEDGQRAILVVAGIVAAIGPLLAIIGSVIAVVPQVVEGFTMIQAAFAAATGSTGLLSGALTALTGPIGIAITAAAALVAAIVYLWNTDDGFREAVLAAWEEIKGAVQKAIDAVMPYLEKARDFIANQVMPVVSRAMQTVVQVMAKIFSTVSTTLTNVLATIKSILATIKGVFDTVVGAIVGLVTGDFAQMQSGISGIMSGIQGIFSSIWSTIQGIVSGAVGAIGSALGFDGVAATVSGVFDGIKEAISGAINGARDAVGWAIDAIKGFFNFSVSWPSIPMPHPYISPPGWSLGDLLKGSTPSIGIDWYATGGVFAANSPQVIGVGDASVPEAVAPVDTLKEFIREAIADAGGGAVSVVVNIGEYRQNTDMDIGRLVDRVERDINRRVSRKAALGGASA